MVILPYQTTLGRLSKPDEYVKAINKAEISLSLPPIYTVTNEQLIDTGYVTPREEHDDIPNFAHIINLGDDRTPLLVVDGRQYMRYDERTGVTRLIAANDWQLQCVRVALTRKLITSGTNAFARMTDFPAKVFMDWISGTLVQRYTLRPESEMALRVISSLYYQAMLSPELREPGHDRIRIAPILSQITSVPLDFVLNLIDPDIEGTVGSLNNANDLAKELSTKSRTLSMGQLKFADLHVLLKASWFGTNASDNVGMALEHLPTWIAVLYTAVSDRSYRKSKITERAERQGRSNDIRNFIDLVGRQVTEQFV
ncbi:virion structural protein [Pseudomonas phage Psa21]|uniref:Virion structural protein n=1 Tax=Pseudomonas phage Psa21 TaxID=2530023 RepID=A0A481W495_9CAUD|nr:virion structural protein [Pseudomonas phage Psa21]QBJ02540.1 virion structural protein [Pseudomonas phage Psa21]